MSLLTSDQELRVIALDRATDGSRGHVAEQVVARATEYYAFLSGTEVKPK